MKKAISFTLIVLLVLALFAGCNSGYRRTAVPMPAGNGIVDGGRTIGNTGTPGAVHHGTYRDGNVIAGHTRDGHTTHSGYHHDGLTRGVVADRDGVIGNGVHADRSHSAARGTDLRTRTATDGATGFQTGLQRDGITR